MNRHILVLLFAVVMGYSSETLAPFAQIEVDGISKDIVADQENLYIGTDNGKLQVYNHTTKTFVKEITVPKVKDFTGEIVSARVSSIDHLDGRFLLLNDSGIGGYSFLRIHENNTTTVLLSAEDKRAIVKARFIDKEHILLGYLGNEASLFDVKAKKELYRVQLAPSKFSDFALTKERKLAAFGCESGVITVIETQTGKVVQTLQGINLDNTFKVDIKEGVVVGAGQDRRGAIYDLKSGKGDFIEGDFLIYATGLSPSAKKVAFSMDDQNNISVYTLSTKSKTALLKGQKSTLNAIVFIDETTLFSASDDNTVMMWKLK
jgi:WD40 repeat protein